MGMKEAMKAVMDAMPSKHEVQEQLVQEVGNIKGFLGNVMSDIAHEMTEQVKHGSHELSAALFNGNAFVMYPHTDKPPEHGLPPEANKEQEQQKEMERGGMELG
ncbi:hypothetical protein R5W24_000555 [Gemmata sp. JC717]|uniref:hypothetical protein n=1 Tax=Gemmata algarum TaxID=2975278 RepID=UPI0021BB5C61|nr:hypothetical protein [Gemmata algarum]MDY3551479.1 hypothetical protein [Gemmata algarum]